ncbi:MAG: ABC transporter substrate-binding protein [Desulfovibrionales bacterium]|nr:ABC transporter substrate-binding protein [Desulfovibrionales bacterium]
MLRTTRVLMLALGLVLMFGTGAFAEKTYINGIDANYPPFAYVDKNGEPAGFDVESLNWIADKLGFKVVHKPMEWSTIVQSVLANKIDMVYSGMSITPERAKKVSFSKPYWSVAYVVAAKKGTDLTLDKIYHDGLRIGVQTGTPAGEWLEKNKEKLGANYTLKFYDSAPLAMQDVMNGRIQVVAHDAAPVNDAIARGLPLVIVSEYGVHDDFGVAINKNNPELLALINKGIDLLKEDPYWNVLKEKYLKDSDH